MEIVKLLIETGKADPKVGDHACWLPLWRVPEQRYEDMLKLEIILYLLPLTFSEHPTRPGHYSFQDVFILLFICFESDPPNVLVASVLIRKFYSKYNSLYPLIEKLKAETNQTQIICMLLHDEIEDYEEFLQCLNIEYVEAYGTSIQEDKTVYRIVEVLLKFVLRGTDKQLRLAVETSKVLLEKNFNALFEIEAYFRRWDTEDLIKTFRNVKSSMVRKRFFQFFYYLLDSLTEPKIFDLIFSRFRDFNFWKNLDKLKQSTNLIAPLLIKQRHVNEFLEMRIRGILIWSCVKTNVKQVLNNNQEPTKNLVSLKESCRNVIRRRMAQSEDSLKEILKGVLNLPLPTILKCYLLRIQDVNLINDLEI